VQLCIDSSKRNIIGINGLKATRSQKHNRESIPWFMGPEDPRYR